ncbi:DUF1990 family protein [Microbacterium aurantiacum]|uniref:DUF1990 family protein n=2 Tax=Microbacterium aurantiacum TaxID=162393 RepID=UPI004036BBAF
MTRAGDLGADAATRPETARWPAEPLPGFRRAAATARIGTGDDLWRRASRDVLRWAVKTRSGFTVDDDSPVRAGMRRTITARVLGIRVHEPVRVVAVVDTPTRVGFAYRTLPGHPVHGEEAFIVHRRGDGVVFTVRSLTAPAPSGGWRWVFPLLRVAQVVARRRYLRALR